MTKPTVVRITSKSNPTGPAHIVVLDPDHLTARCDCPGYLYRGRCRHVRAALAQHPLPTVRAPRAAWVEEV